MLSDLISPEVYQRECLPYWAHNPLLFTLVEKSDRIIPQELLLGLRELNVAVVAHHPHARLAHSDLFQQLLLCIVCVIQLTILFANHDKLLLNLTEICTTECRNIAWKKVAHAACYMPPSPGASFNFSPVWRYSKYVISNSKVKSSQPISTSR